MISTIVITSFSHSHSKYAIHLHFNICFGGLKTTAVFRIMLSKLLPSACVEKAFVLLEINQRAQCALPSPISFTIIRNDWDHSCVISIRRCSCKIASILLIDIFYLDKPFRCCPLFLFRYASRVHICQNTLQNQNKVSDQLYS